MVMGPTPEEAAAFNGSNETTEGRGRCLAASPPGTGVIAPARPGSHADAKSTSPTRR